MLFTLLFAFSSIALFYAHILSLPGQAVIMDSWSNVWSSDCRAVFPASTYTACEYVYKASFWLWLQLQAPRSANVSIILLALSETCRHLAADRHCTVNTFAILSFLHSYTYILLHDAVLIKYFIFVVKINEPLRKRIRNAAAITGTTFPLRSLHPSVHGRLPRKKQCTV